PRTSTLFPYTTLFLSRTHDADIQFMGHAGPLKLHSRVNFKVVAINAKFRVAVVSGSGVNLAWRTAKNERHRAPCDSTKHWSDTQDRKSTRLNSSHGSI